MRQLKGKPKETAKQKKERKKDFAETQKQVFTIALPTIAAVFLFIAAYIYIKTRPASYLDVWTVNDKSLSTKNIILRYLFQILLLLSITGPDVLFFIKVFK